jgi:hypothetical protein
MARFTRDEQMDIMGHLFIMSDMALQAVSHLLCRMVVSGSLGMTNRAGLIRMGGRPVRIAIYEGDPCAGYPLRSRRAFPMAMKTKLLHPLSGFRILRPPKTVTLHAVLVLRRKRRQGRLLFMAKTALFVRRFERIVAHPLIVAESDLVVGSMASKAEIVFSRITDLFGPMHTNSQIVHNVVMA